MSSGKYWGRCDTCGDVMRDPGHPAVFSTSVGTVKFRFCSKLCKAAFNAREDVDDVPDRDAFEADYLAALEDKIGDDFDAVYWAFDNFDPDSTDALDACRKAADKFDRNAADVYEAFKDYRKELREIDP